MTRSAVKRLEPGDLVIVDRQIRRVDRLERRRQGIGVRLRPHPPVAGGAREWALPHELAPFGAHVRSRRSSHHHSHQEIPE